MVEKMTKYSFVLLSGETEGFLEWLQGLGIVDVTRSSKPIDDKSSEMLDKVSGVKKTIGILEKLDFTGNPDLERIRQAAAATVIEGCKTKNTLGAVARIEELNSEMSAARKQLSDITPWGDYDKATLDSIGNKGLKIRYYRISKKKYDTAWENEYAIVKVNEDSNNIWFVTVSPTDQEYSFPVAEIAAPSMALKDAEQKVEEIHTEIISMQGKLLHLKEHYLDYIKEGYARKAADLDRYLAGSSTTDAAEGYITLINGFAPKDQEESLSKALDEKGVLYIKADATPEDNPPIKLKNNRFAKLFEVLTGMYGMPSYGEFDPTPVLAPFFMLFFAMCMGDAGYGIILILFGLAEKKGWIKIGMFKGLGPLIMFLGASTLVVGALLGTVFGMSILSAAWAPEWLKSLCVDGWFKDGKIAGFPAQMVLAVGIGVFHICLAMVIKTIGYTKRFGFKNTISTWGWTLLIVGGVTLAGLGGMQILGGEVLKWAVIALAVVSGLAIYIFNTPGRNPLVNIGSGLWDTYNMATGLLGDVLSYIRLYALGLAGGMLGNAFNIMGTMVLDIPVPVVNWLFCAVILLFGHVLNIAMSCLGAFVHPLRLTFVEYFKNSGYEGTGTAYNPLSNNKTN